MTIGMGFKLCGNDSRNEGQAQRRMSEKMRWLKRELSGSPSGELRKRKWLAWAYLPTDCLRLHRQLTCSTDCPFTNTINQHSRPRQPLETYA